jgi:hypothetical protein
MNSIDRSLLLEVCELMTEADAHDVKTWIFCYETSEPDSPNQRRYERLLRDFVARKHLVSIEPLNRGYADPLT